ncbi:MAG: class I tRNA ligase family protein, partial [Candidatus Aenigmarchaeota archaeon]|nr:class I tRNA ligase family protein [Candidatus Aenigmarchaeota archaeon]
MENKYNPKIIEPKIQKFWEENNIFKFDFDSDKPVYSVDTPPPTVSGNLHVGHMYSYSQFEFMARFWRMRGYNVFLPFGYDNNGLASEILTEKATKKTAEYVGREEFTKMVLEVTKEYEEKYENIFKKIGISCDWSLVYRTNSLEIRKISQRSFVELNKINRVYRAESPSLWCPKCHTALAQVELEDKEFESEFVHLKFALKDGGEIIIATTRPELLASCVSIFVSEQDEKNKELIGKKVIVP